MIRLSETGPFSALLSGMKQIALILVSLYLIVPASAQECRTAATSWQEAGFSMRTEVSSRAEAGCKQITQSIDGIEETGVDCNCDLIIDGREGHFRTPPAYSQTSLLEVCHGPEADPDLYENTPWIKVVEE